MKRRSYTPITREERQRRVQAKRRRARLALPITLLQVYDFDCKLIPVHYAGGICWLYPSPVKDSFYTTMRHNGTVTGPQRFALAVKMGCTVDDLHGSEAGHAGSMTCVGGLCCNPEHLSKRTPTENNMMDRVKNQLSGSKPAGEMWDKKSPRWKRGHRLTKQMYPAGLPQSFEPWLPLDTSLPQLRQRAIDYLSPNPFYAGEAAQAKAMGLWNLELVQ